jgi:hypothetical protein
MTNESEAPKYPGYFPTAVSSLICSWTVVRETEKAVMIEDSDYKGAWFPKSQVIVEAGRIVAVKLAWYNRIRTTSQRGF